MFVVAIGSVTVALWAAYTYLVRERLGLAGLGMGALRTLGAGSLLILLVNPGWTVQVAGGPPVVLLDASLSMEAGGQWPAAVDTAKALAGESGTLLRFGSRVVPFDTNPPTDGATKLRDALVAAHASGRPVHVVSDGEIEDLVAIPKQLLVSTNLVVLPRDTVPDAALLSVAMPRRIQRGDSIPMDVTLGVWGISASERATISVAIRTAELARHPVQLGTTPALLRRRISVPSNRLSTGANVLTVRVTVDGDEVAVNDERLKTVMVIEQPRVVVLVDTPDWESRFLVAEIAAIVGTGVQAFSHLSEDSWLDLETYQDIAESQVIQAARRSAGLVLRGERRAFTSLLGNVPRYWHWPVVSESVPGYAGGDWYPSSQVPASPLVGGIGLVEWDSLPPLSGMLSVELQEDWWTALTARMGRRGGERPVVVGLVHADVRSMITLGSGLWRWRFRGGASREAYRAVLASGMNWLLGTDWQPRNMTLSASPEVPRSEPVRFSWLHGSAPDSVLVHVSNTATDSSTAVALRFDAGGNAALNLEPGIYRWSSEANRLATGLIVVEQYSSELAPRRVGAESGGTARASALLESHARERWYLFLVTVLALAAEWAWRYRRGLP